MSQINVGGVVKGGLAAGLMMNISEFVLNVPVAGAQMERGAGRAQPAAGGQRGQIAVFVVVTFAARLHHGLAVCGDPPAPRRRPEDGDHRRR